MLQLFDTCGQRTFEKGSVLKILVNLFVEVFLSIFGKFASLVVILDVLVLRLIFKSWYSHGLVAIWTSVICQSAITKLGNVPFFNIRKLVCTVCSLRACLL